MLPQRLDFKNTPEGAMEREAHMALVKTWYEKNGYDPATGRPASDSILLRWQKGLPKTTPIKDGTDRP
jgi:hypothetical protein